MEKMFQLYYPREIRTVRHLKSETTSSSVMFCKISRTTVAQQLTQLWLLARLKQVTAQISDRYVMDK